LAYLRMLAASPAPQRATIRTLRPSIQPNCASHCWKAARRAYDSGSSAARFMRRPIRRIRSGCCAHPASGHATVAPPSSVMSSRRLMLNMGFLQPRSE
jgi:hypothetical protein